MNVLFDTCFYQHDVRMILYSYYFPKMKLIPYGSNQNLVEINKDTEIFYSIKLRLQEKLKENIIRLMNGTVEQQQDT